MTNIQRRVYVKLLSLKKKKKRKKNLATHPRRCANISESAIDLKAIYSLFFFSFFFLFFYKVSEVTVNTFLQALRFLSFDTLG